MKNTIFENCFVNRIPEELSPGILYICLDCNVVVHLCACGCGEIVVLPLAPGQWSIKYDGEGVSLTPSIGNSYFNCRSHYYIKNSNVIWLDNMPDPSKNTIKQTNIFTRFKTFLIQKLKGE